MLSELKFTRFTSITPKRLSKRFTRVGNTLVKESGGNMTDGIAERLAIASLAEFAALLPTLKPNQAISYGINGHARARVVAQEHLAAIAAQTTEPVIARTREYFAWPTGTGILMLDHDAPADAPPFDRTALVESLAAACPALAAAPAIWRPSASSCIFDAKTSAELRGIAGQRFYLPVLEAADIPRAGQVLFDRLWLAGFGRYEISKSGALLARTMMDATVFQPERLDGGAAVGKGLVQRLPEPVLFNGDAPFLDTRAALPDLSAEEQEQLVAIRARRAEPLAEERARIREAWITARVEARLIAIPEEARVEVRPHLEKVYRQAAEGGRLEPDFELIVCAKGGKTRKPITVRELLKDRARYHEATTLDPLEPGYPDGQARLVGWLNLNARLPYLQSWAHGGVRYDLGAEETPDSAPMDDGYWESVMQDAEYARVKLASNPSLPSYPSYPIELNLNYSVIDQFQSVISVMLPLLEDVDDKGKPVLIESAVATRLVDCLKNRFAFCRKTLRWYAFVGTHWEGLTAPVVDEVVTQLLYAGAPHGFKARTLAAILSLLTKGLLPLPVTAAVDTRLIPFTNGLLDPITRILTPITPDNALTWSLPYAYDPAASCPTIQHWLRAAVESEDAEDGDNPDDLVDFLRAWLAGLLTGRADLQCFLHLLGPGGTGKGTFIRMAEALVGQHNATVTDLRNLETNRFETAALYGKRLAAITDSSKYGGSVDVLKALTGQDPLRLEVKHRQQGATFTFSDMVLLASNEPLQFTDYTGAIERRRLTVAFDRRVSAAERAAWDRQGGEAAVLHREIPGLVNWILELSRSDVSCIIKNQPKQMTRLNREVMQHSNPIADWLMQCVVPDPSCTLLKRNGIPQGG